MVKSASMENVSATIYGILAKVKVHKFESIFLGSALGSLALASTLLVLSFVLPAQKREKDFYEAPKQTIKESPYQPKTSAGEIVVDIAGAVNKPGIYTLPQPARINDLIEKANGLSEQADYIYVAHTLNLAQTLSDQQKIYIPNLGEDPPEASSPVPSSAIVAHTDDGLSESPLLNINSASKDQLEELPGIGQITAEKIIDGRPYSSVEELSKNGILKKNIFDGLKEKISI